MTKHSKFIVIFVAALFAVFTAGNLLADMPDREPSETQAVVMDKSVASGSSVHLPHWTPTRKWPPEPMGDGPNFGPLEPLGDGRNFGPLDPLDPLGSMEDSRNFGYRKQVDTSHCLRELYPDEEESELESAMGNFAFCLKCPEVCRAVKHDPTLNKPELDLRFPTPPFILNPNRKTNQ